MQRRHFPVDDDISVSSNTQLMLNCSPNRFKIQLTYCHFYISDVKCSCNVNIYSLHDTSVNIIFLFVMIAVADFLPSYTLHALWQV